MSTKILNLLNQENLMSVLQSIDWVGSERTENGKTLIETQIKLT